MSLKEVALLFCFSLWKKYYVELVVSFTGLSRSCLILVLISSPPNHCTACTYFLACELSYFLSSRKLGDIAIPVLIS